MSVGGRQTRVSAGRKVGVFEDPKNEEGEGTRSLWRYESRKGY